MSIKTVRVNVKGLFKYLFCFLVVSMVTVISGEIEFGYYKQRVHSHSFLQGLKRKQKRKLVFVAYLCQDIWGGLQGVYEEANAIIYFKEVRDVFTLSKNFRDQCDIDGEKGEKCEISLGIPLGGSHIATGF